MSTSPMNIALPELPGGSATVLRRLVAPGAEVVAGAPLVIVRTERVEAALPTPTAGHIVMLAEVGATLAPGALLAQIEAGRSAEPALARLRITPTARRIAQLNELDLHTLAGSGVDGRVTKADVLAAVGQGESGAGGQGDKGTRGQGDGEQTQYLASLTDDRRRTDARSCAAHHQPTTNDNKPSALSPQPSALSPQPSALSPQPSAFSLQPFITAMIEADVSRALTLLAEQEAAFARVGLQATLTTVVAQAVAALLPAFPHLNAAYSASGIIRRRGVHLAVGTGTAGGLRWASITHAGELTLRGLARALRDAPPEGDCTFAMLSLPASNGFCAPPPLPGMGALLTIGAPVQRAVVLDDDRIAVRPIATLTLSYDARLLNYAEAGRFLGALREALAECR